MRQVNNSQTLLSMFGALTVLIGMVTTPVLATDIIILREVPASNALQPALNGPTVTVPADQKNLIMGLVPGPKLLDDGAFGAILASPPPSVDGLSTLQTDVVNQTVDGSRNEPLSNLPSSGMGSFSSIGGLGGQISGQVNGAVGGALQGALGTIMQSTGGSQ